MRKKPRTLNEEEANELERLCGESYGRALTRDETIRMRVLQGFDQEDAEWLADAGGLPRATKECIDE